MIYCKITIGSQITYVSYEGMTEEGITAMIAGQGGTVEFITADEFATATVCAPIVPK